ncbi:hypothetical protein [Paraglaciecola chathamensis]|nr:hypothetical protein [Paraglaciecola agarilytica]
MKVDEYCMFAAIGSIAKQLEAFNRLLKVSSRINEYPDAKGYPLKTVGEKIRIEGGSADATDQELQQKIDTTVTKKIIDDDDFIDPEYHNIVRAEATRKLLKELK